MKRKVTLKRIFHRDKWRIAVFFDYDEKLIAKVNSISGSAYSSTNNCFYVDYSEENLKLVLKTLKDVADVDIASLARKEEASEETEAQPDTGETDSISSHRGLGEERGFEDISQPKTVIKITGNRTEDRERQGINVLKNYGPVEFRISEKEGLLVIKFLGMYDPEWVSELRTYGNCYYDKKRKEWLLPWSKMTCDSLADYFSGQGIGVNVTKQVVDEELKSKRKNTGDEIRARNLGKKALDGLDTMEWFLDENRYSPRTRESYTAMLEFFFRYFSPKEPLEITEEEISRFIYDFIIRLGYSAAYQNQMVSAIKTFYTIAGKR